MRALASGVPTTPPGRPPIRHNDRDEVHGAAIRGPIGQTARHAARPHRSLQIQFRTGFPRPGRRWLARPGSAPRVRALTGILPDIIQCSRAASSSGDVGTAVGGGSVFCPTAPGFPGAFVAAVTMRQHPHCRSRGSTASVIGASCAPPCGPHSKRMSNSAWSNISGRPAAAAHFANCNQVDCSKNERHFRARGRFRPCSVTTPQNLLSNSTKASLTCSNWPVSRYRSI